MQLITWISSDALYIGSIVYWTIALVLATWKCLDSRVDGVLSYGLRQNATDRSTDTRETITSGLLHYALYPNNGVSSSTSWKAFYALGMISGLACSLIWRDNEALGLFTAHTARRLLECLLVHRFSPSRVSLAHMAMGASF
eukprot:IDg21216t1